MKVAMLYAVCFIFAFYFLTATCITVLTLIMGARFDVALKMGLLVPFKWLGWL